MSVGWMAGLLAASLAAATAERQPPQVEEDPADEGEDTALAVATAEPAVPLPAAPAGRLLAESAPVLLDRVERPDGTALERLVEPSGEVVLHEVSRAGTVLSCRTVGALLAMRVIEQRDAAGGEVIHVARDASGAILRYVVGPDGEPRAVTVVAPAPR